MNTSANSHRCSTANGYTTHEMVWYKRHIGSCSYRKMNNVLGGSSSHNLIVEFVAIIVHCTVIPYM